MDKQLFAFEIYKAQIFQKLDPLRANYWIGYIRGLKRAFYGESYFTNEEHTKWLNYSFEKLNYSFENNFDERELQLGLGYRDGLVGRPDWFIQFIREDENGEYKTFFQ